MDQIVGSRPRQFFATVPVPCPYLAGAFEQKLVIELRGEDTDRLLAELSRAGFRRSHRLAYKPVCRDCTACVAVRIRVEGFMPTRSLRRVMRRNAGLTMSEAAPVATVERYALFRRYVTARHDSSDMATMTFGEFRSMLEETSVSSRLLELHDPDRGLVGAVLIDRLTDGISAVYSFFEPDLSQASLGTQLILACVERARADALPFVYLGYWIAGSPTMDYKRRFPNVEALGRTGWRPLVA